MLLLPYVPFQLLGTNGPRKLLFTHIKGLKTPVKNQNTLSTNEQARLKLPPCSKIDNDINQ